MRMEIGLSQTMSQKQILSPQMIQSMEILVLNSQQLDERIGQELEENVALELSEPDGGDSASESAESFTGDADARNSEAGGEELNADSINQEIDLLRDRYEHLAEFQAAERSSMPGSRGSRGGGDEDDKLEALQNTEGRPESLQEHLVEQLRLKSDLVTFLEAVSAEHSALAEQGTSLEDRAVTPAGSVAGSDSASSPADVLDGATAGEQPSEGAESAEDAVAGSAGQTFEELNERLRQIGLELIYNLDSNGRLLYPIEEIRRELNKPPKPNRDTREVGLPIAIPIALPVVPAEIEAALQIVQSLDPAGVGAIGLGNDGLRHCLLLQLDRDPGDYPLERQLIRSHLDDIAKNRLPQIAKSTGSSLDEVKDAIEIIRSLNPLPGKGFESEANAFVRPDVLVEEQDGVYQVQVSDSAVPSVRISSYYRDLLEASRKDPEIRKYVKGKIDSAEWLLHAIQQRKSTLQRVAEEVVEHQQEFFSKGVRALKPLKMQDIADKIGVNVSTVSRAISGKYFQAPNALKELKFLFTGGTTKDDGSTESRDSVIMRIKDLVADENSRRPLSDAKIVDLLKKDGITISRRTVTKYREAEGIPSSRERRQF